MAFRLWLKTECGIAKPQYPAAIIAKANRDHPDLEDWQTTWQEAHFGSGTPKEVERPATVDSEQLASQTDEVPLSDELDHLLGRHLDEVLAGPFRSCFDSDPKTQKSAGMEFSVRKHCRITAVFLHSEGHEGFREYQGRLPGGIVFANSRKVVRQKLGEPSASRACKVVLGMKVPTCDRYDFGTYSLHISYAEGDTSIVLVTLMTPGAVPK